MLPLLPLIKNMYNSNQNIARSRMISTVVDTAFEDKFCISVHLVIHAVDSEGQSPIQNLPEEMITDGLVIINVNPKATRTFIIGEESITLEFTLGGAIKTVYVPVGIVAAVHVICGSVELSWSESFLPYLEVNKQEPIVERHVKKTNPLKLV